MKLAIIFPAQMRCFSRTFANQHWMVFRHLEKEFRPEFFVSAADDADAASVSQLSTRYAKERIHIEVVAQPAELPEPSVVADLHAPYRRSATRTAGVSNNQALCRGLWHLSRTWDFIAESVNPSKFVFFLSRGDYHFQHFEPPRVMPYPNECFLGWHANYGGSTGLGFFGCDAMRSYLKTWEKRQSLLDSGCPFHPESLVHAAMQKDHIVIRHTLMVEWVKYEPQPDPAQDRIIVSEPLPHEIARFAGAIGRSERGTP